MKLSEAIRLGAMLGPQVRKNYILENHLGTGQTASCAVGAAMLAAGFGLIMGGRLDLVGTELAFPILNTLVETSPNMEFRSLERQTVWSVIIRLNDHCLWSREAIADWVEGIENKLEESKTKVEINVGGSLGQLGEMADTADLKSAGASRKGSTPLAGT